MSRLNDLIKALAPNGVRYVALGDVAKTVGGLNGKTKADFSGGTARYVSYKNVYANIAVDTMAPDFVVVRAGERQNRLHADDILVTGSSENLQDVGISSVVLAEPSEPLYLNSFCFVLRFNQPELLLSEFSKYLFRAEPIRKQIRQAASGVTRINISKERFMKIRVPLPPIEVQNEVVRILDRFSDLATDLQANLDEELGLRRRQHEHYRRELIKGRTSETETVRLGDVVNLQIGFPFKSSQFSSDAADTRLLRGDNIGQGFLHDRAYKRWRRTADEALQPYELQVGDVVLAMDRPWVAAGLKWAQLTDQDLPALLVQRVARLRANVEVLDQNYLARLISSTEFTSHILGSQNGNTVPHISGADIANFAFSIPTLSEQRHIAKALGEFDKVANDLGAALPAEVVARRKQYEYYRDRLLTFKELAA